MDRAPAPARIKPDLKRIERDIEALARFRDPGQPGFTRLAFSEKDRRAREHLAGLMAGEAKLSVRIDAAGNLIGLRPGLAPGPSLMVGSHLDTVRGGGRFDGVAGVVAGLELARRFEEEAIRTRHSLEVVVFLAEEPSPFGLSAVGSRALAGRLPAELLGSRRDDQGRTLAQALALMGGDPDRLEEARRRPGQILAFLEMHVEQGRRLFDQGLPLGLVSGLVGILRGRIEVRGRADHAGATPMAARRDALAAAAEAVLALEDICRREEGLVGTVGRLEIRPNSPNVVPGAAGLDLEIRSLSRDQAEAAAGRLGEALARIQARRGLEISLDLALSSPPVSFDRGLIDLMGRVCRGLGLTCLEMPSGAGHDAANLAKVAPAGMIFIPSREGRSHCPEEWSEFEHLGLGLEVMAGTILQLDRDGSA